MAGLWTYILRRMLYSIPLFLGITIVTFSAIFVGTNPLELLYAANPGLSGPAIQALQSYFNLNKPVPVQYLIWLNNLLHLNFGVSIQSGESVNLIIGKWAWTTFYLQITSISLALLLAIFLGTYVARHRGSRADLVVTTVGTLGFSIPSFWLGEIMIIVFGLRLEWLPAFGAASATTNYWWGNSWLDALAHLIMPMLVLTYYNLAIYLRLFRVRMVETLSQDYVTAAKASGVSERRITYKYALREAIGPLVTYVGLAIGLSLGGAPIIEYTFGWPGLGLEYINAALVLDFPVILAIVVVVAIMTIAANVITDIVYGIIDPRVVYT